jgi:transcriptional regulator of acetoin/glycerol metabolism
VLEEQEVTPLGSETAIKVNLRVICASHRNLREMVARGEFREDLYYRLNGITLELPPLRSRSDKETLVRQSIARESPGGESASIERAALERLFAYPWPGNIRELRNTIRTALALCTDRVIRVGDLPDEIRRCGTDSRAGDAGRASDGGRAGDAGLLESAERQALLGVMQAQGWNMSRVAETLGISRNTLYRKIKRHGIVIVRARQ